MPLEVAYPGLVLPDGLSGPASITGLKLWLRADSITGLSDGAAVASWLDSSGNANDFSQGTASQRPVYKTGIINGLPIVRFDGINDFLSRSGGSWIFKPVTFVAVVKKRVSGTRTLIAQSSGSDFTARLDLGNSSVADSMELIRNGGGAAIAHSNTAIDTASFHILTATYSSVGAFAFRLDRSADGSGTNNVSLLSNAAMLLGADPSVSTTFDGDLAELCMYDSVLSSTEIGTVEDWLYNKYFGAGNLVVNWGQSMLGEIEDVSLSRWLREVSAAEANRARPIIELRDTALIYKTVAESENMTLTETAATVKAAPTAKEGLDTLDLELQEVRSLPERQVSGQTVVSPERFPYPGASTKDEDTKYMGFAGPSTARRTVQALESGRFAGRLPYSNSFSPVVPSGEEFEKYPTPNEDIRQNLSHLTARRVPLDPTSIRGLVLWLKPEDLPAAGNPSDGTLWPDSSGKANNGVFGPQVSGSGVKCLVRAENFLINLPLDNIPGIVNYKCLWFQLSSPANTQGMDITGPSGTADFDVANWTMFMVCAPQGSTVGPAFGRVGTFQLTWRGFGGIGPSVLNSVGNSTDAFPGGGWQIMTARQEGPPDDFPNPWLKTWTNAVWSGSKEWNPATYLSSPAGRFMFGAAFSGSTPAGGAMAEFLFYNRALTEAERYSVEVYLFDKFRFTIGAIGPYVDTRWVVA